MKRFVAVVSVVLLAGAPRGVVAQGPCGYSWTQTLFPATGFNGAVRALAVFDDGAGPRLYVGGSFTAFGSTPLNHVAKWDGTTFTPAGIGLDGTVYALTVFNDGTGPALYAGGAFTSSGTTITNLVAKWNGTAWLALGPGIGGFGLPPAIFALGSFNDGTGPTLYAGGQFTFAGTAVTINIAKWNGSAWSAAGSGVGGLLDSIHALAAYGQGAATRLYAGGFFTFAGTVPCSAIAAWDGAAWSSPGTGLAGVANPFVTALAVFNDGSGAKLYAGGNFAQAGAAPASFIARWNATSWGPVGAGTNNYVYALHPFDDGGGPGLYAAGDFTTAGGAGANRVARWRSNAWTPLTSGLDGRGYALSSFQDGPTASLYSGGTFATAGGTTSARLGRWGTSAPYIVSGPTPRTVCQGAGVMFSVTATGAAPIAYQWRRNGTGIAGATSTTFSIAVVSAANVGVYDVVVSNACGGIASAPAALAISGPPVISSHPSSQTVCAGATATLAVVATSSVALTYQWFKNGVAIQAATSATYVVTNVAAFDAGNYQVAVSGCGTVTTNTAILTVAGTVPSITTHPIPRTVCNGLPTSFSVVATGTPPLMYVWRKDGIVIAGATSATLSIPAVSTLLAGAFSVVVSNACGSATSNGALLSVASGPVLTVQPPAQTVVCQTATVVLTVAASGSTPLMYQWRKNGSNIAGATGPSYTIASATATDSASYSVQVSNTCGMVTGGNYVVAVHAGMPMITQHPANQTVCSSGTATFSVVASGSGPISYQWQLNNGNIAGATSATLAIVQPSSGGLVRCLVSNGCGLVVSNAATLTIGGPAPMITVQPPAQVSACQGDTVVLSVVAASPSAVTYQWARAGVPIPGATAANLTFVAVTSANAGVYSVTVGNACSSIVSTPCVLQVSTTPPTITSAPPPVRTACVGAPITLAVTVSGSAPLTYQWRRNGMNIPGATSSSYSIASVTTASAGTYTVLVTNPCGGADTNPSLLVVQSGIPTIVTQPASQVALIGQPVNFSVVSAAAPNLSYQWRRNGVPITGATSAMFSIAVATYADAGNYSVDVTNACGTTFSQPATLGVFPILLSVTQPFGPGSLAIVNTSHSPGALYFYVISTDPANALAPGMGPWAGLHIATGDIVQQFLFGVPPFVGFFDAAGGSSFILPAGTLNAAGLQVWSVTVAADLPTATPIGASNVARILMQ